MYDWKKTIVKPSNTLLEILSVLDNEALRIALVVDEENKLIGALTDGDVRRALLKYGNLLMAAETVMNKKPILAHSSMPPSEIDALLRNNNILAVPVVDNDNFLVGLHSLRDHYKSTIKENPIFIMAGGFGTRLKPLTDNCPKPMLKVGGKPILETILETFIEAGFRNFYFSTHYLPEVIQNYFGDGSEFGCSITYVHEAKPLGTGGALGLLPNDLPNLPIIMINGDILTKVNIDHLLEDHKEKGGIATMCVRQHQYQVPYGVIQESDGNVIGVDEKPVQTYFINAGIYVLEPELLKDIEQNVKIDMPPFLMKKVEEGKKVNLFPIHEYWLDIGQPNEFEKAQCDVQEEFIGK
ncbi:MAG: nucleotidyltransferase family protein [Emcibacteraceae bacterium]